MKKSINLLAATALFASAAAPFALAQDATVDPATPAVEAPSATGVNPSTDTMNKDVAPKVDMSADASATTDTYLTEQAENQVSANEFIGSSVYNGKDESIGDINDLIIGEDGKVAAAVIGVGGFLGIGEKDVAVPMAKIDVTHDENNDVRLTTVETAESLEAAPAFKTLDQQAAEADTDMTTTMPDNTTTSSTAN